MSYCTEDDIAARLGEDGLKTLSDRNRDGVADAAALQHAIGSAAALIDSYLGIRFAVPVDPVPDALRTVAVDASVYFLQLGCDSVTDDVRRQHELNIGWLRDVVRGTASLGAEATPAEAPGAGSVRYQSQPRLFGREEPL